LIRPGMLGVVLERIKLAPGFEHGHFKTLLSQLFCGPATGGPRAYDDRIIDFLLSHSSSSFGITDPSPTARRPEGAAGISRPARPPAGDLTPYKRPGPFRSCGTTRLQSLYP